jgi:NTP pyrophosphatase (non-canonical NTP hydrolase)
MSDAREDFSVRVGRLIFDYFNDDEPRPLLHGRILEFADAWVRETTTALQAEVERLKVADAALHEVARQSERWKIAMPRNEPAIWVLKIVEEVGELSAALLGQEIGKEGRGDVLEELNQVIAVALAIRAAIEKPEEKP